MKEVRTLFVTIFLYDKLLRCCKWDIRIALVEREKLFTLRPLHQLTIRVIISEGNWSVVITVIQELCVLSYCVLRFLSVQRIKVLVCIADEIASFLHYGRYTFR